MFSLTESVAKFIKQAEVELEGEYATYCGQVSVQSPEERQESLNLRADLNRITAQCQRKAGLLMRLRTLSKFPVESQPLSPEFALLFDTPSNRISELQSALEDVKVRTETEEQQSEVLQAMLVAVTQAATIVRERTTATQAVLNRVSNQLFQVSRLHTVAVNSLTLTSVSASHSRFAMVASKELALDRINRKKSDKVVLERASRKAVERIGTAVYNQAEIAKRKQVFREILEAAGVRHAGEKQCKAQTARNLELYYHGFHTIAQVLARRGCTLTYQSGISTESIHMLVAQLNHLAMREASLVSHHSHLAIDRCEKEAELRSLRSELLILTNFKEKETIREESHSQKQQTGLEGKAEELCIRLQAGVISVLGQLDFAHQQTSHSSIVDPNWSLVHSLVQGFAQLPVSPESVQRSSTRSKTFITSGKAVAETEQWTTAFHICPTAAEVRALAREIGVKLKEEEFEVLDWLTSRTLVAKHCADRVILKEFLLRVKKQRFEPETLLEKCHMVLRSGFKEIVDAALEAIKAVKKLEFGNSPLSHLSRTTSCRSLPSEEQISPMNVSKRDKHYARLRISLLPCKTEENYTEESHSQPQSQSEAKRPDSSKPPSPLCDETAETQHILAIRSEFKSSRLSTAAFSKRSEPFSTVRLRHLHERETPPTTERAQNLLRDFLATERRIAAVKGAERVSAKAESARQTPKATWTRTSTAVGYRRHHRSTLSLGSVKATLQF